MFCHHSNPLLINCLLVEWSIKVTVEAVKPVILDKLSNISPHGLLSMPEHHRPLANTLEIACPYPEKYPTKLAWLTSAEISKTCSHLRPYIQIRSARGSIKERNTVSAHSRPNCSPVILLQCQQCHTLSIAHIYFWQHGTILSSCFFSN